MTTNNKKELETTYVLKNQYNYKTAKTLSNSIFLYVNYNFHPLDQVETHVWATLNPVNGIITKTKVQPRGNDAFGSLVNSWVDTHVDKIVYANTTNYAIRFYNNKFEQIDSIITPELNKNNTFLELCKVIDYSRERVIEQAKIDDSLLTRIIKVYYVNDTSVLALIKLPQTKQLRIDYWQKAKNKWALNFQQLNDGWYEKDAAYSPTKISYNEFYQNVSGFVYTGNLKFSCIEYPYMPILTTTKFNLKLDYVDIENKIINEGKTSYGIKTILLTPNR